MADKIIKFTGLEVWQWAHKLRLAILQDAKNFPSDFKYGLAAQIQRSSISVGSNIAESFGRKSRKEKTQFYNIARGSLIEVQDQLIVAKDLRLITVSRYQELDEMTASTHRMLNALIRKVQEAPSTIYKPPSTEVPHGS